MALRIDCRDLAGDTAIVVAGELGAAGAAELKKLCRGRTGTVTVDLEQLVSVDAASIAILRALRNEGARLVGASHYIRMLIDRNGRSDTHPDAAREDA